MLPTTNELLNLSYMEQYENSQAEAEYNEYLDSKDNEFNKDVKLNSENKEEKLNLDYDEDF